MCKWFIEIIRTKIIIIAMLVIIKAKNKQVNKQIKKHKKAKCNKKKITKKR